MSPNLPKGIRTAPDFTYWHPRPTKEICKIMDEQFDRVGGKRWAHRRSDKTWNELPKLKSKVAYLIGKGPSLDAIVNGSYTLEAYPIITVNEACNPLIEAGIDVRFTVCCDANKDYAYKPNATIVCAQSAQYVYPDAYTFKGQDIKIAPGTISAGAAIALLARLGVTEIICIGFDASQNGDISYAKSLGYGPSNDTQRYRGHSTEMQRIAEREKIKLSFPEMPSSYKEQPLQLHLQEHHAYCHEQSPDDHTSPQESASDVEQAQRALQPDRSES